MILPKIPMVLLPVVRELPCFSSARSPSRCFVEKRWGACSALQALVALAVVAAALLNPFQIAVGVAGLVGVVLVKAGVHAGLALGLLRVFLTDRGREYGVAARGRSRCSGLRGRRRGLGGRGRGRRRGRW